MAGPRPMHRGRRTLEIPFIWHGLIANVGARPVVAVEAATVVVEPSLSERSFGEARPLFGRTRGVHTRPINLQISFPRHLCGSKVPESFSTARRNPYKTQSNRYQAMAIAMTVGPAAGKIWNRPLIVPPLVAEARVGDNRERSPRLVRRLRMVPLPDQPFTGILP